MSTTSKQFQLFELGNPILSDNCDDVFPTALHSWNNSTLELSKTGTHFGFVSTGIARLQCDSGTFTLQKDMYFCVPGDLILEGGAGIVITRIGFAGAFSLGGPIENSGRLRYIDGCRDTLLIPPVLKGDPCLNALYFPAGITQTPHTHPSVRVGIVARGSGDCITESKVFPLNPGSAFIIAPEALHSFNTRDDEMVVIAYHPDSDFGATHEDHPMVNRTIVDGISASLLENIRTKGEPDDLSTL